MREGVRKENRPFKDTIWYRCLWELLQNGRAEGKAVVEFQEVDDLVVEYSRLPIEEFREKFQG